MDKIITITQIAVSIMISIFALLLAFFCLAGGKILVSVAFAVTFVAMMYATKTCYKELNIINKYENEEVCKD